MADDVKTPGLASSEKGQQNVKKLVEILMERQVKEGERKGSFHPKRMNAFYWDYTAPLALLAAAKAPDTKAEDKERYLNAAQEWLKHSYRDQNEDGTIKPFGLTNPDEILLESSAGVVWVAAKYKEAVKGSKDEAARLKISDKDPDALDKMVSKAVKVLAENQGEDGLLPSLPVKQNDSVIYYTTNAHMHGALHSVLKAYPADSQIAKDAKAVEDKLVKGLKEFSQTDQDNIPFMKGSKGGEFQQYPGHTVIVDAYSGALEGDNKYVKALKAGFEKTMADPKAKREFYAVQTVPYSVPTGLQAAGYKSVTIAGKEVPLSELMDDQLQLLMPQAKVEYVHKVATAAMLGLEGSDWLPKLEAKKTDAPELEKKKDSPMETAIEQAKAVAGGVLTEAEPGYIAPAAKAPGAVVVRR